jgi:hypothetical protein
MVKESPNRAILRIGYRCACGYAPETTLASILPEELQQVRRVDPTVQPLVLFN